MKNKGIFIALEGIDGAGTTTQKSLLGAYFEGQGREVLLTAEPSQSETGLLIRRVLQSKITQKSLRDESLALLFAADRLTHLSEEIIPALASSKVVICDRYVGSSIAYQGVALGDEFVSNINQFALKPQLTFYLKVSVDAALARVAGRGEQKEIFEERDFLEKVASRYNALASKEGFEVIDGHLNPEQVCLSMTQIIQTQLGA